MGFWFELGVAGFRVDAAPFLIETGRIAVRRRPTRTSTSGSCGTSRPPPRRRGAARRGEPDTSRSARLFRRRGRQPTAGAVQLSVHAAHLSRSGAPDDAGIAGDQVLDQLPPVPFESQWVKFLRHHDELKLDKLTDGDRAAGVRRLRTRARDADLRARLAPAPGADARTVIGPAFASPTACSSGCRGRRCSSTARRSGWARARAAGAAERAGADAMVGRHNGGFSTAPPQRFVRPILAEGDYGFERVSVAANEVIRIRCSTGWRG